MSRMILPGMVLKECGVVINLSSSGSLASASLITVYLASKVQQANHHHCGQGALVLQWNLLIKEEDNLFTISQKHDFS